MTDAAPTIVTTTTVVCDGDQQTGGHPRVYLKIDSGTGKVTCPYCSKMFVLDANAKTTAH